MVTTPAARPVVAAFDVDGTLTVRDCVRPFLVTVGGYRSVALAIVRNPMRSVRAMLRRDRDAVKEIVVGGVLRRRRVTEVDGIGARFAERVRSGWLRTDTLARLRWHQRNGHRVVLVSASLGHYLRPLGRWLGVDDVLCTEAIVDGDTIGDRLDGANCRAAEKVRRLDAWLARNQLHNAEVWAYGDSAGDRQMLERADHPVWVKGETVSEQPAGIAA